MQRNLAKLMSELFEIEQSEVTDGLSMKNMEVWDSLKHMELVVSIEQGFGVELTFDEIVAMQTVKEIKRILREKGVAG